VAAIFRWTTIDRQSVAYRLTLLGKGLLPVLREIQNFTKRNVHVGLAAARPTRTKRHGADDP
jgi:DNA-binding HxlR family transcriptional regulator